MTTLRPDLAIIAREVRGHARILDVGCGDGLLMAALRDTKGVDARGMELNARDVATAVARGLSVVQGDADIDLAYYPDGSFDYAILSQTLQTLRNPKDVLEHMVRIARHAIISVPNFGHWKNRLHLMMHGRMPVTKTLSYQWYDTPNIHFCTITDFVILCESLELKIEKRLYVDEQGASAAFHHRGALANLFGQQGIFMVSK